MRALPLLLAALLTVGCLGRGPGPTPAVPTTPGGGGGVVALQWAAPVDLKAIGYEPSIAVDSKGALFITAHKDLTRPDTWPYLASWILVSTDKGASWHAPAAPGGLPLNPALQFVGDEGDLAVDARDYLYYVDTYLADEHIHVWSDQGKTWQYSGEQKTTQLDDRPWLAAQGNGVVHYLGNNGQPTPGLRYIYYRSTDGGLTFTPGTGLPFSGWAQVAAPPKSKLAFVTQEVTGDGAATDIMAMTSKDEGATWGKPVKAGHRNGTEGDGQPILSTDPDGNPALVWVDTKGGDSKGTRIFLAASPDHGETWSTTEITPFAAYIDHVTVAQGAGGLTAVAFYATKDLPLSDKSQWRLYAGMARGNATGAASFGFKEADPQVLYTGTDKHALHDFFEIVVDPDGGLDVAYMTNLPAKAQNQVDGDRHLWFARGVP